MLDYVSQSPTAVSSFLGAKEAKALALYDNPKLITDAALASSRVLTPGQRFDVSVSLSLPETRHNVDAGVFQVRAELLTARGEVIANATRPAMLGHTGAEVRLLSFCRLPCSPLRRGGGFPCRSCRPCLDQPQHPRWS